MNGNELPVTLLTTQRGEIEVAMGHYLRGPDASEPSSADNEAARRLVDVLIASFRGPEHAADVLAKHPVPRPYYARFGDGLLAVLKDVVGEAADTAFLSHSIDGYWRAVRSLSH